MKFKELIEKISNDSGIPKFKVKKVLELSATTIVDFIENGGDESEIMQSPKLKLIRKVFPASEDKPELKRGLFIVKSPPTDSN